MKQVVEKKKAVTHTKERLSIGLSFHFWISLDCWIPLGLMKPSELCDVGNINNLDLGTVRLKLGFYSATSYPCDPDCALYSLRNYYS